MGSGTHGCREERPFDEGTTAKDGAMSSGDAAIPGVRCAAGEACCLATREEPEFRQEALRYLDLIT